MHPAIKGALVVYQVVRAIDELSDGKLRKEGKKIVRQIIEKRGLK